MMDYHKQEGLFTPHEHEDKKVTIIGAGSVGSFVSLALAKMGVKNITIFDYDTIETHNIPNQFYRLGDIGKPKVEALKDIVKDFTPTTINTLIQKVTHKADFSELDGVVICAVDSMKARKMIWKKCKEGIWINAFIDCRMGGEVMKIFTVKPIDPDDQKLYEATLHTDEQADSERCSVQTIIYNVLVIAGLVANQVKKVMNEETYNKNLTFDLKTMTLLKDEIRTIEPIEIAVPRDMDLSELIGDEEETIEGWEND